jgi:hypothetical protein
MAPLTGHLGKDIALKLTGYLGYMPEGGKLLTQLTAILFVPLGTAMVVSALVRAPHRQRALLGLVALAAAGPTLLYGYGSYPRFEFSNLWVILLSFLMLEPWALEASRGGRAGAV